MAAPRQHVFAEDVVGPVAAANIEDSTALQRLAAVPPKDLADVEEVLLGLEPAQALALCRASDTYQDVCDRDDFIEEYRKKWMVDIRLVFGVGEIEGYSLFRTRNVGDVKYLYERDVVVASTGYTFFYGHGIWAGALVPTAQSSLGGMSRPTVMSDIVWLSVAPRRMNWPLTHWFANGERIELSE